MMIYIFIFLILVLGYNVIIILIEAFSDDKEDQHDIKSKRRIKRRF